MAGRLIERADRGALFELRLWVRRKDAVSRSATSIHLHLRVVGHSQITAAGILRPTVLGIRGAHHGLRIRRIELVLLLVMNLFLVVLLLATRRRYEHFLRIHFGSSTCDDSRAGAEPRLRRGGAVAASVV